MKRSERLKITFRILPDGSHMTVVGRDAWALKQLTKAGSAGCTPITHVGPRWSGYVLKLRKLGICIETIHEMHGGEFAGRHAKYVLRSEIGIISDSQEQLVPVPAASYARGILNGVM
jgi:hypothetical protein